MKMVRDPLTKSGSFRVEFGRLKRLKKIEED